MYTTWQFPMERFGSIVKRKAELPEDANWNLPMGVLLMEQLQFLPYCSTWEPRILGQASTINVQHPNDPNVSVLSPSKSIRKPVKRMPESYPYLMGLTSQSLEYVKANMGPVVKWGRATRQWNDVQEAEILGSSDFKQRTGNFERENRHVRYLCSHQGTWDTAIYGLGSVQYFCETRLDNVTYMLAYI